MFLIYNKNFLDEYIVFGIRKSIATEPKITFEEKEIELTEFLIWKDNNWLWINSEDYRPLSE